MVRISTALLALLLALPAMAAPRGNEASARATILGRFDAALRGDVATLDKLLADDLDYCTFRGDCETKAQYIGEVKSGRLKYVSIQPTVDRVKLYRGHRHRYRARNRHRGARRHRAHHSHLLGRRARLA